MAARPFQVPVEKSVVLKTNSMASSNYLFCKRNADTYVYITSVHTYGEEHMCNAVSECAARKINACIWA